MADELDEIRSRINIVDLVGQSVRLKKSGKNFLGLCPFHDDKRPSFRVSPDTGWYQCWSCGEKGSIFDWVMKTQNMTFSEALQVLAKQAGVALSKTKPKDEPLRLTQQEAMKAALEFFRSELGKSTEALEYCENRGLTQEIRDHWEIGYAPDVGEALVLFLKKKGFRLSDCRALFLIEEDTSGGFYDKFKGRLMFPIRDERGELVGFGGRLLGQGHPKYINSSDTPLYRKSRVLYGMYRAKNALKDGVPVVLTEGYLDVIACHTAGVATAVASLGTALSEDHAKLIRRYTDRAIVLYDSDTAGENAAARATEIFQASGIRVRIALMPKGEDPDTLLRQAGPGAVQKAAEGGLTPTGYKLYQIQSRLQPDQEEYWDLVSQAIAEAPSDMERTRYIETLAPLYPDIKDVFEAKRSLRKMVDAMRRRQRQQSRGEQVSQPNPAAPPKLGLKAAETQMIRALLDPQYRREAWETMQDPDLFLTLNGVAIAKAVSDAFPLKPPTGKPLEWLSEIDSEDVRALIVEIDMREYDSPLSEKWIQDSIRFLQDHKNSRSLEKLKQTKTDEDLRELLEKLRKLKED